MRTPSPSRGALFAWTLLALLAVPAAAEPPPELAERSFRRFAASWMKRIGVEGERDRKTASAAAGVKVRRAGADFSTQLQATGKPAAPYVGILSYIEHVYSCKGPATADCEILESEPITEIFPLQGGEWRY